MTQPQPRNWREEVKRILTPIPPRDAEEHGGVKTWEYQYNSAGLKNLLDKIDEIIIQAQKEAVKEFAKEVRLEIENNYEGRIHWEDAKKESDRLIREALGRRGINVGK